MVRYHMRPNFKSISNMNRVNFYVGKKFQCLESSLNIELSVGLAIDWDAAINISFYFY